MWYQVKWLSSHTSCQTSAQRVSAFVWLLALSLPLPARHEYVPPPAPRLLPPKRARHRYVPGYAESPVPLHAWSPSGIAPYGLLAERLGDIAWEPARNLLCPPVRGLTFHRRCTAQQCALVGLPWHNWLWPAPVHLAPAVATPVRAMPRWLPLGGILWPVDLRLSVYLQQTQLILNLVGAVSGGQLQPVTTQGEQLIAEPQPDSLTKRELGLGRARIGCPLIGRILFDRSRLSGLS